MKLEKKKKNNNKKQKKKKKQQKKKQTKKKKTPISTPSWIHVRDKKTVRRSNRKIWNYAANFTKIEHPKR